MNRNMQSKILGAIQSKVEKAGLDYIHNSAWANTGRVYVQPKDGFTSLFGFCYGFHDSYCTIQFYGAGVEPVATCGFTHEKCIKNCGYLEYSNAAEINEMLSFVDELVRLVF